MLKPVTNTFGQYHYSADHDAYLMEDSDGKQFWLDGGVLAESVAEAQKAEPTWTYEQAKDFTMTQWDVGMDGITEA